jgi:hypothetical protein
MIAADDYSELASLDGYFGACYLSLFFGSEHPLVNSVVPTAFAVDLFRNRT